MNTSKIDDVIDQLNAGNVWGSYYVHRYYFSINTRRTRESVGLTENLFELTEEQQYLLQAENLPAMLHEFMHYLHEVSTIVGHAAMMNRMTMRAAFTSYQNSDINTSESFGAKANYKLGETFSNAGITNAKIDGSGPLITAMKGIESILYNIEELHFPIAKAGKQSGKIKIPEIIYFGFDAGKKQSVKISLGRFYMYECLAYEIDQWLIMKSKKLTAIEDPQKGTEYTVCRMVAQHIVGDIKVENLLAIILLALQHIDCGNAFVLFLYRLKQQRVQEESDEQIIDSFKPEVIEQLSAGQEDFIKQQNHYAKVFNNRRELSIAFKHIAEVNKYFYGLRIQNPCFELDFIFKMKIEELLKIAEICDYLYMFKDRDAEPDPKFERDYLGTTLPEDVTVAMKALVGFDHYFSAHLGQPTSRVESNIRESYTCPFFTCCTLSERKDHQEICRKTPWRIYDLFRSKGNQQCWYGTGVLEAKAATQ